MMFVAVDLGEVGERVARAVRGYLRSHCIEVVGSKQEHCRNIVEATGPFAMGCWHSLMLSEVRYSIFVRSGIVVADSCCIFVAGDAVVEQGYCGNALALA